MILETYACPHMHRFTMALATNAAHRIDERARVSGERRAGRSLTDHFRQCCLADDSAECSVAALRHADDMHLDVRFAVEPLGFGIRLGERAGDAGDQERTHRLAPRAGHIHPRQVTR